MTTEMTDRERREALASAYRKIDAWAAEHGTSPAANEALKAQFTDREREALIDEAAKVLNDEETYVLTQHLRDVDIAFNVRRLRSAGRHKHADQLERYAKENPLCDTCGGRHPEGAAKTCRCESCRRTTACLTL